MSESCLGDSTVESFVRGQLEPGDFARAEQHLAGCVECRGDVAEVARSLEGDTGIDQPTASHASKDQQALEPETLVGRYVIKTVLGFGGMGVVYQAHDTALNRSIALKLLRGSSADGQARLFSEARAMARLSHPNVVSVHDVGTFNGQVFVAMELVAGSTFRAFLERTPRPWRENLAILIEAGRGLCAAHAAGMVHRDFKPDNVLVGADGRVRVTDFGLARSISEAPEQLGVTSVVGELDDANTLTKTGMLKGTLRYMGPEQFAGLAPDMRSDQFSFCVAAYECVYRQRPFEATSAETLARAVCNGAVREPPAVSDVPMRVRAAIMRGLRVLPEQRFASLNALLDELTEAAKFVSPPARAKRGVIAVAAAVVLMVTLGIGLSRQASSGRIEEQPVAAAPLPVAAVLQPARPPVELVVSKAEVPAIQPAPAPAPSVVRAPVAKRKRRPDAKPAASDRYDDAPLEPSFVRSSRENVK